MSAIMNPKRAKQLIDFEGISYGKIRPTDIDAMIEYKDKAYIFCEVKYKDKEVPFGQKLALERMVDDAHKLNKKAIAIVVEHHVEDVDKEVILANCYVREVYTDYRPRWTPIPKDMTVKYLMDCFISKVEK